MTDERSLVGLLQRADWTRLTLSAEVSDGSSVRIAPGKRYRYRTADYMTGCDGARPWELSEDDTDGSVHWISGPRAPLQRLLCPAWLLERSRLELRARTSFLGREALDVVMTPRPSLAAGPTVSDAPVEVIVDAETGILLRVSASRSEPEVELVRADFAPVIDESMFRPPSGSRIAESFGNALGPGFRVGATAVGLAAGALGAWIRYSPFRRHSEDPVQPIARDEPPPSPGTPVGDDIVNLLHAGGSTALAVTLDQWLDVGAMAASVPATARRAGLGGLGLLMDAISEKLASAHIASTVVFAGPARYQIDYSHQLRRSPVTIACDGQRTWEVYPDKVTIGPAKRPPSDIGQLVDPSWLLRCTLSGGAPVRNGAAYRITVISRDGVAMLFPAAVAVVDARLGIILRLTYYIGDRPVHRYELRDIATDVADFKLRIPQDLPGTEAPGY